MADPDPKPPNPNPPPIPLEEFVRHKKPNRKSKNDVKVSGKNSNDVSKSSHVSFKKSTQKNNTRSGGSAKSTGSVKSMDENVGMEDEDENVGMEDGEVQVNEVPSTNEVSVMFPEVKVSNLASNSVANLMNDKNCNYVNKDSVLPDIPIPFHENPVLNPKHDVDVPLSQEKGSGSVTNSVLLGGESNKSGVDNGMQGLGNSESVIGESSKDNDVDMQDYSSFKKPMSFSNDVKGIYNSVNNRITTSMCERANGRANFARVLVEVDATKGIIDSVEVCYKKLEKSMHLNVEYAWRPPACSYCKVFGHNVKDCKKREVTVEETMEVLKAKTQNGVGVNQGATRNDGWQEVQGEKVRNVSSMGYGATENVYVQQNQFINKNGPNYARGGGNFRGRGGYGRGGFNGGRVNYDNKNATTNTKMTENSARKVETVKVNKANEKVNVKEDSKGKNVQKEAIKTMNRFGVLVDEDEASGSNDWQNMKMNIDVACDLGIDIPDDEKKEWTKELHDYYKLKCKN
ncbi:hypothetical protein CTI12_AA495140 [Artemisia annua]|uniref:Zinc knuckle CX2CX4HX4C n=1 Tax=Artemisia annua TaxID=35608 RepID=A0A2U1LG58_ARTAN|nr:hypothetical protein CTI12_AA495140 [Artemisia annua]